MHQIQFLAVGLASHLGWGFIGGVRVHTVMTRKWGAFKQSVGIAGVVVVRVLRKAIYVI